MRGKGVSNGVAIGRILYSSNQELSVEKSVAADVQTEINRFEDARLAAVAQLGELAVVTAEKIGRQNSLLFEIHQMMLEDDDFQDAVTTTICSEKINAEYAVQEAARQFENIFSEMDDEAMKERAADVRDVSMRLINILAGKQKSNTVITEPVIMAAYDFTPSETAQFDREKVLALITAGGAANSHTAIFARTMGIPAVIGLGNSVTQNLEGKMAIVDGDSGSVIIEPDSPTLLEYQKKIEVQKQQKRLLEHYKDKQTVTKSGQSIKICANIGSPSDIVSVLENGAEGVGLFRSEFLFLGSNSAPDEEAQFQAYKEVLEKLQGKQVIVRTMDIGADKQLGYLNLPMEENPALGMRAIRISLTRPAMFKTQLRALYRASVYGNLGIMFPMITSLNEIHEVKHIIVDVQAELDAEGFLFNRSVEIGIMIETPAAAIISDLLAKDVDFFSIGTNDLTQYTLAIDRQNDSLTEFCDTHHEAILRLIRYISASAHENNIWVGICGKLAGDLTLTDEFLKAGIDELSVAPSSVLPLRKLICQHE